jgi:anti-sigma regulatory factor (Ser/Thr protein kinase)
MFDRSNQQVPMYDEDRGDGGRHASRADIARQGAKLPNVEPDGGPVRGRTRMPPAGGPSLLRGVWSESFPLEVSSLAPVRALIRQVAQQQGLPSAATGDLVLAVTEAASNAIVHSSGSRILVRVWPDRGCVRAEVIDDGTFLRRAHTEGTHGGRGILLMAAIVDEVAITAGTHARPGTVVRIMKCAGSA